MPRRPFYLSKSDRRGLCVIAVLLLCLAAGRWWWAKRPPADEMPALTAQERAELDSFEAAVGDTAVTPVGRGSTPEAELFPFDPNTADSLTLRRLGLKDWQVRNMMKYRRRGGVWRSADDFARLYGLSADEFARLRPYIRVASAPRRESGETAAAARDTLRRRYPEKYPAGTVIDLNTADTTMLKRIPGIGSYYAAKICRYRERLGGFVSLAQLREVEGLPTDVEQWFKIEGYPSVTKINVNSATFKELVRHPYLSYEQVKIIVTYRQKYGRLNGWQDLQLHDEFGEAAVARLRPYFSF